MSTVLGASHGLLLLSICVAVAVLCVQKAEPNVNHTARVLNKITAIIDGATFLLITFKYRNRK